MNIATTGSRPGVGYDPNIFIDSEFMSEFTCSYCYMIARFPLTVNNIDACKHMICSTCMWTYARGSMVHEEITMKCAATGCTKEYKFKDYELNYPIAHIIESKPIRCPNTADGCTETTIIGHEEDELIKHLSLCSYQKMKCTLCSELIIQKDLEHHIQHLCEYRNITCHICQHILPAMYYHEHISNEYGCQNVIDW